jgi:hypothetical protein
MATTNMRIVIRRDTKANWDQNSQVVLLQGEQGYEINVDQSGVQRPTRIKVGDGISQWGELPYFNGGITAIDEDTIIMDASGKIMFNKDLYLGGLTDAAGDSVSVKDYVDIKVSVEAEARTNGDSALGARIDQESTSRQSQDLLLQEAINGIGNRVVVLETDPTTKAYVDGLILGEASVRADMDSLLGQRINITNDSIDTLNTTDIFLQNQISENKLTSEQTDTALGELFDSVQANLEDSVAALEIQLAAKADLDSVASVLQDVDSYVGNYQGGATISEDLVSLASYNSVQDTVVSALIAGDTAFTGSITAPGFNGALAGNANTATLAAEASAAESGGALDTRLDALEADPTTATAVAAVQSDVDANETASVAAIAAVQADVDQNEADADAAIAAVQADVDQNESDADAAIAAVQADVDANETTAAAASAAAQTKADDNAAAIAALKTVMANSTATTVAGLAAEIAGAL